MVIKILIEETDGLDDEFLAVKAAFLGEANSIFPDLSDALFIKSVNILRRAYNSREFLADVNHLFDIFRCDTVPECPSPGQPMLWNIFYSLLFRNIEQRSQSDDNDRALGSVLEEVMRRLEKASRCPNCHLLRGSCLSNISVTAGNFVPGAKVKISKVRFCLAGNISCYPFLLLTHSHRFFWFVGSNDQVTLGNPAVHTLRKYIPPNSFSSFSQSGLPLAVSSFHSSMFVYDC